MIELLVVISISMIGIMGVIKAFPLGTQITKSSELSSVAIFLAQEKMEEMVSKSYEELVAGEVVEEYGSDANFNSFKRTTNIVCVDPDFDMLEIGDCIPDLGIKKIEVIVYWNSVLSASEESVKLVNLYNF